MHCCVFSLLSDAENPPNDFDFVLCFHQGEGCCPLPGIHANMRLESVHTEQSHARRIKNHHADTTEMRHYIPYCSEKNLLSF